MTGYLDNPMFAYRGHCPAGADLRRRPVGRGLVPRRRPLAEVGGGQAQGQAPAPIIVTTHYMREAEELCDTIAFIKAGTSSPRGRPTS